MILLARHGETDDNREPIRFQGFHDVPLNETGRAQARELAERVAREDVKALYSSDLDRARETAEIVGGRIGVTPQLEPRLRESNRGRWEGRYFHDVQRDEPEAFAAWMRGGAGFRFPGGESLGEHLARVVAALEEIAADERRPALAVCHGGTIRVALCHAAGDDALETFHSYSIANAELLELPCP